MLLLRRRDDTLAGKTQGKTSSARPVCPPRPLAGKLLAPLLARLRLVRRLLLLSSPCVSLQIGSGGGGGGGGGVCVCRLMVGGAGPHRQTV